MTTSSGVARRVSPCNCPLRSLAAVSAGVSALARFERDAFPLVFATIYQLRELAAFNSVKAALDYCATHRVPTRIPVLVQADGKARVFLQEDSGNTWEVPEHMRRG